MHHAHYHPNPTSLGGESSQSLWLQRSQCDCCEQHHRRRHWAGHAIPNDDGESWKTAVLSESLEREGDVSQEAWETFKERLGEAVGKGCFCWGGYSELLDILFWLVVCAGVVAIEVLAVSGFFDGDDGGGDYYADHGNSSSGGGGGGGTPAPLTRRLRHLYTYVYYDDEYNGYHHEWTNGFVQLLWWTAVTIAAVL